MPLIRFEIVLRRPLAGGATFAEVGPYEELKGQLRFAVDPAHPANRRITDVELAPRNPAGRVEFAADVSILLPVERRRANGRLVLDVVNRGNTVAVPNFNRASRPVFGPGSDPHPPIDVGDGFLMRRGYTVASCGWQADLPDLPGLLRLQAPEAVDGDGRRLRGRVHVQLQISAPARHLLLSDRGHRAYPAVDLADGCAGTQSADVSTPSADPRPQRTDAHARGLDAPPPDAILTVRDHADGEPMTIPRDRWRFARVAGGRVVPDPHYVHLDGGFEKGRLYQVTYTAVGAPVLGLGMAALRECASWLKHGSAADDNPVPGAIQYALAYGRSQTGRLLRTMVYDDLNLDEQGREALDGIIANVAGGMRGEFNQRFGQNSKDRPHMMAHLFPFTDVPATDAVSGATDALHRRIVGRGSALKVIYTNSAAEYHRGDASLIHTDPDGARDIAHGRETRVYHFAGTEHGLGVWPPTDTQLAAADPTGTVECSLHLRGTLDYGRLLRACLVNLDRWVTEGLEPPPNRHPRIDAGTAVTPGALKGIFDRIPGARYPRHHPLPLRLDFGADPEMRGTLTLPPRVVGPAWGSRVSAVDDDGNEVAGIALPELAVPLATHTGWTLRHPDIGGADQLLVFAGATIPFARTRRQREAAGDPRPSIEERYASRGAYLEAVRRAATDLARERYLLDEDVELSITLAARLWDYIESKEASTG